MGAASLVGRVRRIGARLGGRLGACLALIVVLVTVLAGPASAHASLVVSQPADGDVLAAVPKVVQLTFSEPIELDLSRIELQRPDASHVPIGTPTLVPGKANQVEVPLGHLERGNYIVTWHAATRDGHIASGQLQFSLGAPLSKGVAGSGGGLHLLSWASGVARCIWYLAFGLTVGLLYTLLWARWVTARASIHAGPGGPSERDEACIPELRRAAAGGLYLVAPAIVTASLLRLVLVLLPAASNTSGSTSRASAMAQVLTGYQGRLWIALIAVGIVLTRALYALMASTRPVGWRSFGPSAALLVGACVLEAASGHAATHATPVESVIITGFHLAAVSLWIGPLVAFVVLTSRGRYRNHPPAERSRVRRSFLGSFSPIATGSLSVLVVSGILLGAINLGPIGKVFTTAYGKTVAAKVCLLGLAAGVGLYHRLSFGRGRARQESHVALGTDPEGHRPRRSVTGRLAAITVPVEVALLTVTVALAAGLTGLEPARQVVFYQAVQAKAHQVVARPADCTRTPAFLLGCWTRYFDADVQRKGALVALTDLDELNNTGGPDAQSQCHQLAHEIGRAAARRYSTLYESLNAGNTLGNICDAGYWHGLLEATIASMSETTLLAKLNTICIVPGVKRYSFADFNCVHGLGHGLTLRYGEDIFQALPTCDKFVDSWDQQTCYGGVFMQNIIADQVEGGALDLKASDPIYPCDAVVDKQKSQCYGIVTSNILKVDNQDYHAAFGTCGTVEKAYVETCYRSMGRDISGAALVDPAKTLVLCEQATNPLGLQGCIEGAVANSVDNDHNAIRATQLCQIVPASLQHDCLTWRDDAASVL